MNREENANIVRTPAVIKADAKGKIIHISTAPAVRGHNHTALHPAAARMGRRRSR